MSISLKLKLSLLGMIIVPQVLIIIVALLISPVVQGKADLLRGHEVNRELQIRLSELNGEFGYVLDHDPSRLEDRQYISGLIDRFDELGSGIIVLRGAEPAEYSSWIERPGELAAQTAEQETIKLDGRMYYVHRVGFTYAGGETGEIVMLFNYEPLPVYLRPLILLTILGSVIVTHLVLSYLVSRSLTRPLHRLKEAADQMSGGNLDFNITSTSGDEIGRLGHAFENMRQRLKASMDQSAQYEANRKELLSHISHDLKTPITAIKGYVEGILDGVANTDEKRERYMRTIYRKAADMDKLIDELFLFSKLDLNKEPFELQPVELRTYLSDYLEERAFDMEKAGVQLDFTYPFTGGVYVLADREKLSRVLSNIIDNSLKYMPAGERSDPPRIVVILSERPEEAVVEIRDNGPGVGADVLPHVFERFYRAEQSRSQNGGGSGLGLAIVRRIIEAHGGSVQAQSVKSRGMSIQFSLPKTKSMTDGGGVQ
ncbi:HAMP domain-containing histidine kinase [Paenibacillus sp. IB182496]|uniref:histidine kinase n=1 Tax=Paenibacillus sabuli TaxID=2772509 RepID=A0A927GSQ0_9BACL|nr:HAMP domain-containing sensor histidine kinase [Paenibacillus sabuli]MBD2846798.1 HAMP domain-containing histidine kinase [Paenibacillus sabuli]